MQSTELDPLVITFTVAAPRDVCDSDLGCDREALWRVYLRPHATPPPWLWPCGCPKMRVKTLCQAHTDRIVNDPTGAYEKGITVGWLCPPCRGCLQYDHKEPYHA